MAAPSNLSGTKWWLYVPVDIFGAELLMVQITADLTHAYRCLSISWGWYADIACPRSIPFPEVLMYSKEIGTPEELCPTSALPHSSHSQCTHVDRSIQTMTAVIHDNAI